MVCELGRKMWKEVQVLKTFMKLVFLDAQSLPPRRDRLQGARRLDSFSVAQLEMCDQPLMAERCECHVFPSPVISDTNKQRCRHAGREFLVCVLKSFQFLCIITCIFPKLCRFFAYIFKIMVEKPRIRRTISERWWSRILILAQLQFYICFVILSRVQGYEYAVRQDPKQHFTPAGHLLLVISRRCHVRLSW